MANIIDVLLSVHDEEKYHSRVLTWLLDPVGSHQLGRAFFDTLLELAFPNWAFGEIEQVRAEVSLDVTSTVDIGVTGKRQLFMIENKTRFSSITEGQVERYLEAAKMKAPGREIRLVHLLPGPQKEFPHLDCHGDEVALMYWAQIAEILRSFITTGSVADVALPAIQAYHDYITRTIAQGGATVGLHPDHPRMSLSRSGFNTNFGQLRNDFLAEARTACAEHLQRLDLIHAFVGFLENLRLVRVQYKSGKTHQSVSGGIPRADGGMTCVVGLYANGRIWFEYARLPNALADEYRRMTFNEPTKSWREVWIETLPLAQTMDAIRTIATKASMTELPVGMQPKNGGF